MKTPSPERGFGTRAVHGGQAPDPTTGAVMPPIYQTSTYVQPELGKHLGWVYSRGQNPTREALERNLASLEGGTHALAFSSGVAAIECVLKSLSAGDHVVCEEAAYAGTTRMARSVYSRFGINFTFVDGRDLGAVRAALRPKTKLLMMETPTNPTMGICDLAAMSEIARAADARLVVDNTFATPFNQRPLAHGVHIVAHSTSKYLGGHSDIVGGALVVADDDLAADLGQLRNTTGPIPGPLDAWLVLRGTKTLHLRMRAHNENGMKVARYLEAHAAVERTLYPGLESHPQHALAARQMSGFGGVVTVDLGTADRARRFVEGTELFALAESLGGVESLIGVSALMTHGSVPKAEREAIGVTDGLVRLSVGIEDGDDLLGDLERALEGI
ncbi:MAG: PLP-dependent aspartate aminotransferase family protein [Gemmatimonadota bacterium]